MFQFTVKGTFTESPFLWDCISLNSFEGTVVVQLMLLLMRSEITTFNMSAIRINKGSILMIDEKKKSLTQKNIYMNCIIATPTVSL